MGGGPPRVQPPLGRFWDVSIGSILKLASCIGQLEIPAQLAFVTNPWPQVIIPCRASKKWARFAQTRRRWSQRGVFHLFRPEIRRITRAQTLVFTAWLRRTDAWAETWAQLDRPNEIAPAIHSVRHCLGTTAPSCPHATRVKLGRAPCQVRKKRREEEEMCATHEGQAGSRQVVELELEMNTVQSFPPLMGPKEACCMLVTGIGARIASRLLPAIQ